MIFPDALLVLFSAPVRFVMCRPVSMMAVFAKSFS